MARKHRSLRVALLLLLVSCAERGSRRDGSEPVTAADLQPLPAEVTPENARDVLRRALQQHRVEASSHHRRYGYAFRSGGFVQMVSDTSDRGREKVARTYVDFSALESADIDARIDTARFGKRFVLMLRGTFRRWEAWVTPYRSQPEIGSEPETAASRDLEILFEEEEIPAALVRALEILSSKKLAK
jgi:hypothetical protein